MNRFLTFLSFLIALLLVSPVHADILLEPYAGYLFGKTSSGSTVNNMSGTEYGARVGYQSLGFMVGAEYMTGAMTVQSSSVTPGNLGVFAGYDFPILVRAYGVYYFMASDKYSGLEPSGSAMKFGVGFKVLPLVSLNLEYFTSTFNKNGSTGASLSQNDNLYGVSISVPLTF